MNSIVVTGGLGFIGSNFIRMILRENLCDSVLNIDKQTYAGNPENLGDLFILQALQIHFRVAGIIDFFPV
jgi:dTDP-D-glucose 4,6-dehydratase